MRKVIKIASVFVLFCSVTNPSMRVAFDCNYM